MLRETTEARVTYGADQTVQRELLERLSPLHRQAVSFWLDLSRKSSARQIAAIFKDEARLRSIVTALSEHAQKLLTRAVFEETGEALALDTDRLMLRDREREETVPAKELERYGLAFAFCIFPGDVVYHVPADLRAPLRRLLMASYAWR